MTKTEVFDQVKTLIVDQLDVAPDKITPATNFTADLALDSLDVFEVIDQLEDKFDIEIDTDESLATVGALTDYVVKQVNASEA
ncbi:acyl carrier protein [Lactiplantibacillus carotarum]|uniref:acyl carrier protein n=1 Tax=Lactiplantibacillus carotarum TaxID=2993456 RepID=UPI00298EDD55|nr:acyl carrier protein [Lactiplantibacillus carotarum]